MEDTTVIISGGTVICEDGVLPHHDVYIRNRKIAAIRPTDERTSASVPSTEQLAEMAADEQTPALPVVIDARGAYVAPGMIDIHSDYVEIIASPRPSVVMDMETSLYQVDRLLASYGVTTIYHSLSLYGQKVFDHKPIRNFDNVVKLVDAVRRIRATEEEDHLIRHRLHLRIEVDAVAHYERIREMVADGAVDMISFMDHTPGQGQYADLEVFSHTLKGYRDLTDEDIAEIIHTQQTSNKLSLAQMMELSRLAHEQGISVASHDDDSLEKLDCMQSLNTLISEFPITLDVAHSARERGMHTLAGAPNVLLGRSHSGNLSAREAVKAGAIDVLCSDYYPAAMASAAFILHKTAGLGLAEAFALVSCNPAQAAGISNRVGSLAVGKRADIVVLRELPVATGVEGVSMPVVTETLVGGRVVFQSNYPVFDAKPAAPRCQTRSENMSQETTVEVCA